MKKGNKLKYFVIFNFAIVILYTAVVTTLTAITGQDFSSYHMVFCGIFGGSEFMATALIKIFKIKKEKENE